MNTGMASDGSSATPVYSEAVILQGQEQSWALPSVNTSSEVNTYKWSAPCLVSYDSISVAAIEFQCYRKYYIDYIDLLVE